MSADIEDEDMEKIDLLIKRYPQLNDIRENIVCAYELLISAYRDNKKLLIAGNGGSAADAEHIVGELMKGFKKRRPISGSFQEALAAIDGERGKVLAEKLQGTLRAINLANHPGLSTAFSNDVDASLCFAQQVMGYGDKGDVFLGISTSGNSENVIKAAITAKALGVNVIALTGEEGGGLSELADVVINVPERETYKVQELHLPIYHCLCLMLEEELFDQ